jgi:RHS repeat-associated protein
MIKSHGSHMKLNCLRMFALAALLPLTSHAADFGRTTGSFGVDAKGRATYSVPIWVQSGPRGLQPSIGLSYDSSVERGDAGIGWILSGGGGSIERCQKTQRQDGAPEAILMTTADRYCLSGLRLRVTGGVYGQAGSTYQTEIAEHSLVTAFGAEGNGPQYFEVKGKDGLIYEYGNTVDSRIKPGASTTVLKWMLNKVRDRNGNNYILKYMPNEGGAGGFTGVGLLESIEWTPTSLGASTYRYKAEFEHQADSTKNAFYGFIASNPVVNKYRLKEIRIKSNGVLFRRYTPSYQPGPVTGASRMNLLTECATTDSSNCFLPLAFEYQNGQLDVTAGTGPVPPGSNNNIMTGRYDFNGDGKDDIAFKSGNTWMVAFGANSGFSAAISSGLTNTNTFVMIDRFLPSGRDAMIASSGGNLFIYRWNDATSQFVSSNIGAGSDATIAADFDGDNRADLGYSNGTNIQVRRNTSTADNAVSFAAASTTAQLPAPPSGFAYNYAAVYTRYSMGLQRADINGDDRQDIHVVVLRNPVPPNPPGPPTAYYFSITGTPSGFAVPPLANWVGSNSMAALKFNDDKCTDRQASNIVYVSQCNGVAATTVTMPAAALQLLDWDGDGKTDMLSNNSGNFGVYLSNGTGFGSLQTTAIPSSGFFYPIDQDGDGADDLIKTSSGTAIVYWTHTAGGVVTNYATHLPDLLSKATDGFGVSTEINYTSTGQNNYSSGTPASGSLQEAEPKTVVAMVRTTTGTLDSGGNPVKYDRTYHYTGARFDAYQQEEVGFEKVSYTDSRDATTRTTSYEQLYPYMGLAKLVEWKQSDGKVIASDANSYQATYIDNTPLNYRLFVYAGTVTSKQYEVSTANGGSKNGVLIVESVTSYTNVDAANGNFGTVTKVVTDHDSIAPQSPTATRTWTTTTTSQFLPNVANWCLGMPTSVIIDKTSTVPGAAQVTRTTSTTPNYVKCRPTTIVSEPNSQKYKVTTDFVYDDDSGVAAPDFGNISSITVTGNTTVNGVLTSMAPRTTTTVWNAATGQFPVSIVNAAGESVTYDYNYDLGVRTTSWDANSQTTSFQYDGFARLKKTIRPDGVQIIREVMDCAAISGCLGTRKTATVDTIKDVNNQTISDVWSYFDTYDRKLDQFKRGMTGSYSHTGFEYEVYGRVRRQSAPCIAGGSGCTAQYWTAMTYDLVGRPTQFVRSLSTGSATTSVVYSGRTVTTTDANNRSKSVTHDVNGQLRLVVDAAGYSITHNYDANGNPVGVSDNQNNTLWTASYEYPIAGSRTGDFESNRGAGTYIYNSLGELIEWTDAEPHTFKAEYDAMSRMTKRIEPDLTSEWVYGNGVLNGSPSYDSGLLRSTKAGTYEEIYTYDIKSRLSKHRIKADGADYDYDYAYDPATGLVDATTYPISTTGYRFKLKHAYQNGVLKSVADFAAQSNVYWTANSVNAYGQYTQETMINGVVAGHTFDLATALVSNITAGVGGGNALQNEAYLWDAVGNLTQRQSQRGPLSLTEDAYYDNLNRLDYTTLKTNGGAAVTNYNAEYDIVGRTTSWQMDGASPNVLQYATTNPLCTNYGNNKVHAYKTSTQGAWASFQCYDKRGNATSGGTNGAISGTITWTSYNQPLTLGGGANASQFYYNQDHQRWKQVATYNGGSEVTRYIGSLMEVVTTSVGTAYRHYIHAGNNTIIYIRSTTGSNGMYLMTKDHLGSTSTISDAAGAMVVNASFPAFGGFYRGDSWTGVNTASQMNTIGGITRRGFTGHEMLSNVNAVNMNGRAYSGQSFLSPDPFLTAPTNTQNYNRYSYVYNNPFTLTDPSGFDAGGPDMNQYNQLMTQLQEIVVTAFRCGAACQQIVNAFGWANLATIVPQLGQTLMGAGLIGPITETGGRRTDKRTPKEREAHAAKKTITCSGPARVLGGNPSLVGQPGGMIRPVEAGSAAVIPRQFPGGGFANRGAATPYLRTISPYISGTTAGGQSFSGVSDVMDHAEVARPSLAAQDIIMGRDPGHLIIELVSGHDEGRTQVTVTLPASECPANTSPVEGGQ